MLKRVLMPVLITAALLSIFPALTVWSEETDIEENYTICEANYQVTIKNQTALVDVSLEILIHQDQWTELELCSVAIPLSLRPLPREVILTKDSRHYKLLFKQKGSYKIAGHYVLNVHLIDEIKRLTIPLMPANFSKIDVKIPETGIGINILPEANYEKKEGRGYTSLNIMTPLTDELTITWGPKEIIERPATTIILETGSTINIELGLLTYHHHLKFTVAKQPLKSFKAILPAEAVLIKLEGKNLDRWFIDNLGNQKVLNVFLTVPVYEADYELKLVMEQILPELSQSFEVSSLEMLTLPDQRGRMVISSPTDLTLEFANAEHLKQYDVPKLSGRNVTGFRYTKLPARVTVTARLKQPRISVRLETLHQINPNSIRTKEHFLLSIKEIGINTINLKIPEGFSLLTVQGDEVMTYAVEQGRLNIMFKRKLLGVVDFSLELEKSIKGNEPVLIVSTQPEGILQFDGLIGIKLDGVEGQVTRLNKVQQINTGQLSGPGGLKQESLALAFQSAELDQQIELKVTTLKPIVNAVVYEHRRILEDVVESEIVINLSVKKAPLFTLHLTVPGGLTPLEIYAEALKEWTFDEKTRIVGLSFHNPLINEQSIKLRLEKKLLPEDTKLKIEPLAFKPVPKQVEYWLSFAASDDIVLKPVSMHGITEIGIKELIEPLRYQSNLRLGFNSMLPEWNLELNKTVELLKITANLYTGVIAREGQVKLINIIEYQIKHGSVNRFRVKLPDDALNIEIKGNDIKNLNQQGPIWEIKLGSRQRNRYALTINYDRPLADPQEARFMPLQLIEAELVAGVVLICPGNERTEIDSVVLQNAQLSSLRDQTVPELLLSGLPQPPNQVITFAQTEPKMSFKVKTHELSAMLPAKVVSCDLFSLSRPNGELVTYMNMVIENTAKQYLVATIPTGTILWGAFVDDKPVKPIINERGEILTPLMPEKGMTKRQTSVVLVYLQDIHNFKVAKKVALEMPKTDLNIQNATWHLFLPEKYYVSGAKGNMELVYHDPVIAYPGLAVWAWQGFATFIYRVRLIVGQAWRAIPPVIKDFVYYAFISLILCLVFIGLAWFIKNILVYLWQIKIQPIRVVPFVLAAVIVGLLLISTTQFSLRGKPSIPKAVIAQVGGPSRSQMPLESPRMDYEDKKLEIEKELNCFSELVDKAEEESLGVGMAELKNAREMAKKARSAGKGEGAYDTIAQLSDEMGGAGGYGAGRTAGNKKLPGLAKPKDAGAKLPVKPEPVNMSPTKPHEMPEPLVPPSAETRVLEPQQAMQPEKAQVADILSAPVQPGLFVRTEMGLSRGALPLKVSLPLHHTYYYAFESSYLGNIRGNISFYCISSALVLFLQLLGCLMIGAMIFYYSRINLISTIYGCGIIAAVLFIGQAITSGLIHQICLSALWFTILAAALLILMYRKLLKENSKIRHSC